MEESALFDWLFAAFLVMLLIGLIAYKICADIVEGKKGAKIGTSFESCRPEDCTVAAEMLTDYLFDSMDGNKRQFEECLVAGCDGKSIIRDSRDVHRLVRFVHRAGGRIVVRRVSDNDIECDANTALEVKRFLTELDIARAKRINRKYRR